MPGDLSLGWIYSLGDLLLGWIYSLENLPLKVHKIFTIIIYFSQIH